MIRLARPFSDGVIFQRGRPILLWGNSDKAQSVRVRLNGETAANVEIPAGDFTITLPAQEAMEDAVLEVGEVTLRHVDVGEATWSSFWNTPRAAIMRSLLPMIRI